MTHFLTTEVLETRLPQALTSPQDNGNLKGIIIRPAHGQRVLPETCFISAEGGLEGDHWAKGCWKVTADGKPDPDVQICIMNARVINLIAGTKENWPAAGDNFFVDLDLSQENLKSGQRLRIGSATIEITSVPHDGCVKFAERYGKPAAILVNSPRFKKYRLRGIYARVAEDGTVSVGDRISKVDA